MTTDPHPIDTEALQAELEAAVADYRSPNLDLAARALSALTAAEHRATRAEARIKAMQELHTGTRWPGITDKPICDACDQPWPCPTIRALDGEQ